MIGYDKQRKTYFVQFNIKDPLTGKWRTTKKRGFKYKREAAEYEAKIKANNSKDSGITGSLTFQEVANQWEDNLESSETSRRHHREAFEIRFSDFLDKPIKSITKPQLIAWRSELSKKDYGTKTKNTTMSYVRSVFKFANEVYSLPNVAICLKNFKKTDQEAMHEMQVWTIQEFNTFIEAVDNELYKIYFKTLFWTGARRGEIIALQCSDLIDCQIYIHGSQRNQSKGITPTKTKEKRMVSLDENLYQELLKLKKEYKHGYLFGGKTGLSVTTIDRYFKDAIKKSGVKPIRLHDLRHSHATILINNGVNIVAVSKRLGHASVEQTLKTYTHLLKDTDKEMMNKINKLASNN